ncbi:hypothetical protein AMES_8634 [Amycolatopsis mediterranei S699]|uniref:GIY-YIG domain-containing protein n=2 Tax=Amycolatopsis mediterranei TaxID=33910 RepID=A0A0H3DHT8_AMYMU|nr:hypothetical protein [Amycolatopsis mediterranei]ADJ50460.1 hypothetical protein AMED_8767 [Amycolatopsis mediterranei U32]AEK47463.1 hypothetical protein RAM_44980 [Amycolatopsis mediterranei S699]AFO82166.1 hypothetical protein AMES_8634 [Amycolatopsis mediterranei S699]AGT89295.1 hypothetical protein B737_8635 [Amycolatopsis mediterranei RB]KDO08154.1 hypothetical protein DV26_23665 [Amycolatopsis mediterranei]
MFNSTRDAITELIGSKTGGQSRTVRTDMLDDIRGGVGVYVTESADGRTLYIGSVYRPNNPLGIRAHLREHLGRAENSGWAKITIFPMAGRVAERDVRQVEGIIAIWLVPAQGHAWPRVRRS